MVLFFSKKASPARPCALNTPHTITDGVCFTVGMTLWLIWRRSGWPPYSNIVVAKLSEGTLVAEHHSRPTFLWPMLMVSTELESLFFIFFIFFIISGFFVGFLLERFSSFWSRCQIVCVLTSSKIVGNEVFTWLLVTKDLACTSLFIALSVQAEVFRGCPLRGLLLIGCPPLHVCRLMILFTDPNATESLPAICRWL